MNDLGWQDDAACARIGGDHWHAEKGSGTSAETKAARRTCGRCSVRLECLTWALQRKEVGGIWGGLTERERRAWTVDGTGALVERHPRGEVAA